MGEFLLSLRARFTTPAAVKSLITVCAAVLIVFSLYIQGFFKQPDFYWLNIIMTHHNDWEYLDPRITLVEISDMTYETCGSPLSRDIYITYLDRLKAMGAKVVILDIFLRKSIDSEADSRLREKILEMHNVLLPVNKEARQRDLVEPLSQKNEESKLILCYPELQIEAYEPGSMVRCFPVCHNRTIVAPSPYDRTIGGLSSRYYYSIPIQTAACYRGKEIEFFGSDPPGSGRPWYLPRGNLIRIGDEKLYCNDRYLYINYPARISKKRKCYQFEDIVARDYLSRVPPDAFKDKIVMLGNSSSLYHDLHSTPTGAKLGVEIFSITISNILDNNLLAIVSPAVIAVLVLLTGIIAFSAYSQMKPAEAFSVFLLMLAVPIVSDILLYRSSRLFFEITPLLLTNTICYPLLSYFRYRETQLAMDMNQALLDKMAFVNRSDSFGWLETILSLSGKSVNAGTAWIALLDKKDQFTIAAAYNCPDKGTHGLDGGLCRKAVQSGKSLLSRNLSIESGISDFEKSCKLNSLLCMPLPGREGILGVMAFGKKFLEDFTESQIRQISSTALITGAFIENIHLNRKLEEVFLEAMKSLAQAIDARDPYTFGHSTRVSEVSGKIARKMGLSADEVQRITLAGVVHDIGKIGVPEAILHKPGKLTNEEFDLMKKHPEIAEKILEPLEQYYSLLPLVAGHHEKISGKGYPRGLKEEEIPLGAKILAVADVFDALSSDRPYRKGSTIEETIRIMDEGFTADLDGKVMETFKQYLKETGQLASAPLEQPQ